MTHYVHHVPGRIRVRTPALKRNPARAHKVRVGLEAEAGVQACEVNVLTGSVTVRYDRQVTNAEQITLALVRIGAVVASLPAPVKAANSEWLSGARVYKASGVVGKAVAGFVVEKLVERSALALVGAIL